MPPPGRVCYRPRMPIPTGSRSGLLAAALLAILAACGSGGGADGQPAGVDAGRSSVAVSAPSAVADGRAAITVTVTARDGAGGPLGGVPVAFLATGGGTALAPASAASGADGVATSALTATTAGQKAVSATAAGVALSGSTVTFVAGPAALTTSTLAASKTTATADGLDGVVLTATVLDAFGNPVAGAAVAFAASGTGNALSPASGVTAADGTLTAALRSTRAEAKALTATAAGLTLTGPTVTFLAAPVSAATSTLAASKASATADGADAVVLTATVKDASGNPVPGAPVTFAATGSGNAVAPASAVTDAAGVATAQLTSTRAEPKAVSATAGGVALAGPTVTFAAGAPAAATSSLTASRASATADGLDAVTLTATVKDAQGNPVAGATVTFTAGGTGNALSPASAATGAAGTATTVLTSTRAEAKATGAAVGGLTLTGPAVAFTAGGAAAATSSLAVSKATATADGLDAVTLTATLKDASGNPVPGVAVTFAASGTANVLDPLVATTSAAGTAAATLRTTLAGARLVSASAGALTLDAATPVTFVAGAPSAAASTLVASKASATADGVDAVTLTATVKDANGNPVPGVALTFAAGGSGTTLLPLAATTGAAGVATSVLTSTVIGSKSLTATGAGGLALAAPAVLFVAGAPDAASSTLVASKTSATADGVDGIDLTVTLKDAQGNPVAGVQVTFAASGSGNTLAPSATATTGADGTATVTLRSTVAGTKSLSATSAALVVGGGTAAFLAPVAPLLITEIGNAYYADRPAWIEVYNTTGAALDLSQFTLRSSAVSTVTGLSAVVTFPLPALSIAPGTYAVLLGNTGSARGGPRVALVGNAAGQVPWWGGAGFVELVRAGATVDFVRFGGNLTAPTTGAWTGSLAALPYGPTSYRSTLARALDRRDTDAAADWGLRGFPTAGGPNDVPAGAADADGIPDTAEVPGGTYAGLDLYAMGARPGAKDVFVEIDRMNSADPGATPQLEALQRWIAMYPPHGIVLHLDAGSLFAGEAGQPFVLGQTDALLAPIACVTMDPPGAGCTSFYDVKAQHLDLARQNIFHYLLFALSDRAGTTSLAFGRGEVNGNDLLMTMANFGFSTATAVERNYLVNRQRLILAHEFGHNLGLRHGGTDDNPDKPNYLSVMSYLYGEAGLPDPAWPDADQRWRQRHLQLSGDPCQIRDGLCDDPALLRADYSDGTSVDLVEGALQESLGLGRPGAAPIDWNQDGTLGTIGLDLDFTVSLTALKDANDWALIQLPFATNNGFNAFLAPGAEAGGGLMPLAGDVQPSLP